MTFEEVLAAGRGAHANGRAYRAGVTLVTNQVGGVASYATGVLQYQAGAGSGPTAAAETLRTADGQPLPYLFSDRFTPLNTGAEEQEETLGVSDPIQPFAINHADKLAIRVSSGGQALLVLVSHGNMRINVPLEDRAGVLVGVAGGIGGADAVYVISFYSVGSKGVR